MHAKTRDLALLGILSLFCTVFAWAVDHVVFSWVFFALGASAVLRVCPETSVRITKFSEHEPD